MTTFLVKYVWLFAGITLVSGISFESHDPQKPPLTLMIDRKEKTNTCMRGYLMTKRTGEKDAKVQCLVLETPPTGATPVLNAIAAGTYKVKVQVDGERGWRLEIMGVAGGKSKHIRLGNCPANLTGCLVPGTKAGAGSNNCQVEETPAAMTALKAAFADFGSSAETMITIQ